MKRITNFLMLLLLAMCGIGASAQTTVSLNGTSTTGGTFYRGGKYSQGAGDAQTGSTWCCSWVNTGSTPQITLEVRDGTWGNMNSYNANGFAMYRGNSGLVNGNTLYYRLAIANGYRINGIEMQFYNANASYPVTLSCNGVSATATSTSASAAATLTVTDLKAQYVDIALTVGANQGCFVPVFNVTYEAADIEYNYSYTMYDASHNELGTGSNSLMGYAEGYTFTAPSVNGYAFLSAVDGTTFQPLDLSGTITATSIVLLYSPILSDLASADATKAYTLTTPRAFIHAESADATEFSRTMVSNGTADMTNPLHQWTFVTLGGNTYLYNVGAKKFASYTTNKSHHLVTSAPAYVTGDASTYKTGYPIVLKFTNDANTDQPTATLNMSAGGVMIDNWTTHDEGNVQQILQVPSVTVVPEAYVANFTCTGGGLTSVYVDGTEVALGTDVVLTSGATVSSSAAVNAIESYNGFTTLAEALADANFAGTVDVALPATLTTVTLNVTRDNRVVKTVTIENVPENTEINVVSALGGTPNYVSNISPTTVTSTDVFENYSGADHKNNLTANDSTKDYGDFFEDEPSVAPSQEKTEESNKVDDKTNFDDNSFENEENSEFGYKDEENDNENVKKKKNKFVIILCAVVIAAALGFIGFCVYNGLSNSFSNNNKTTTTETTTSAEVTTQTPSTVAPTTVPATTEQVTTSSSYNNVVPVVGYGYSYGKKLLEQAGFTVEISDYEYSYDYPEGYIISQTPEGDTSASTGTVVKLVISSGQIQRETEAPATQAQQSSNNQNSSSNNANSESSKTQQSSHTNTNNSKSGFIFPNSDSSYLSNAQVKALSDDDLQLAINEIYARRGRIFKDATLNAYFNSQSWYEGKYTADEFEKNVKFNTYEQKNLQLLINERRSRK